MKGSGSGVDGRPASFVMKPLSAVTDVTCRSAAIPDVGFVAQPSTIEPLKSTTTHTLPASTQSRKPVAAWAGVALPAQARPRVNARAARAPASLRLTDASGG